LLTHAAAPLLLGLAAGATWGGADFAGGLAARHGKPGGVVLLAHGSSLALLLLLIGLLHPGPITGFPWIWSVLSGAAGGIALMLFYEALASGAMGLSAALAGVLTAALPVAVSIFREGRPGGWQIAGFTVAACAIGMIAWSPELPPAEGQYPVLKTSARSLVFSTAAGLGFGLQLVVLHLASAHGSVLRALALSRAGGASAGAVATLLALLRGRPVLTVQHTGAPAQGTTHWVRASWRTAAVTFLALTALTGLLDTAGNGLYMSAALAGRLDVAAVLASLYPGATILLAVWLLHERTTRLQTAGMLLALVAVALISA
jgi:drug/metabolite transporter (DMT)-like permease